MSAKKKKNIEFIADKVKIKTGHRIDGTAEVTFEVGEYMIQHILALGLMTDMNLKVTVQPE